MKIVISGASAEEKAVISICVTHALRVAGFGVHNPIENDRLSFSRTASGIADLVANDVLIDVEVEADEPDAPTISCPPAFATHPCNDCGTIVSEVTFAPNPYESDLHGDNTPVWMCEECRENVAREL